MSSIEHLAANVKGLIVFQLSEEHFDRPSSACKFTSCSVGLANLHLLATNCVARASGVIAIVASAAMEVKPIEKKPLLIQMSFSFYFTLTNTSRNSRFGAANLTLQAKERFQFIENLTLTD